MARREYSATCGRCGKPFTRPRNLGQKGCSPKCSRILRDPPFAQRFWAKVMKGGPAECWPWVGAKKSSGYGNFAGIGTSIASRVSWELTKGPIPSGLFVCHHCDNPPCCNPTHLFVGTQRENISDMFKKGRQATYTGNPGESNPAAKLNGELVAEIRRRLASGSTHAALAGEFLVSKNTIRNIDRGVSWKNS